METTRLAAIPLFADLDEADPSTIAAAAVEVEAAQGKRWRRRAISGTRCSRSGAAPSRSARTAGGWPR
jgi:hypothetical protein